MPVVLAGAIAAGASIYGANKAASSAKRAAKQQAEGIERGITETEPLYAEAQNFLEPYTASGQRYAGALDDSFGLNGQEGSDRALAMYRGSPSAALLEDVKGETFRRGMNTWGAVGGGNSGRAIEDLARRTSDVALGDYNNWRNFGKDMYGTGANAASAAATLASNRSGQILGARTGQGTAIGSGTAAAGLYNAAGTNAATNYLMNAAGNTDFSKYFNTAPAPTQLPAYTPASYGTPGYNPSSGYPTGFF